MRVVAKSKTERREKPKPADLILNPTERWRYVYVDNGLDEPVAVPRHTSETDWSVDPPLTRRYVDYDDPLIIEPNYHLWPVHGSDAFSKADGLAHNAALRKFIDKVDTFSSMYEDIHERQQSIDLVVKIAQRTLRFVKAVKAASRGDFKKLRNHLRGRSFKFRKEFQRAWKHKKKLPEGWLEYKFGVVPLVGSIETLATALSKDVPYGRIRGSGRGTDHHDTKTEISSYGFNVTEGHTFDVSVKCTITAYVVAVNPHKAFASLTGVYAPLSSAWSVVPWGWAADYFLNVGELISNLEPRFPGVSLSGAYTSYQRFAGGTIYNESHANGNPLSTGYDGYPRDYTYDFQYFHRERSPGMSDVFVPEFSAELSFSRLGNLMSALYLTFIERK